MLRSLKAQTIVEYMVIAAIIMAGIVIGGPFLARSISGHFRLLEDSVIDSVDEDIRQADPPPLPPGACDCSDWWVPMNCGRNDPCTPSQKLYQRTCNPSGCAPVRRCVSLPNCCTEPLPYKCGDRLIDDCPRNSLPPAVVFSSAGYRGTCSDEITPNCPVGERIYSSVCGVQDPDNPYAQETVYACLNTSADPPGLDCAPSCWDASRPDGTPYEDLANPGNVATECNGDETSNLVNEIIIRLSGVDDPVRPVTKWLQYPQIKMYNAYKVINTYFDPEEANRIRDGHDCNAGRRCEFLCPENTGPIPYNGIANGTCGRVACLRESDLTLTMVNMDKFRPCNTNRASCTPSGTGYRSGPAAIGIGAVGQGVRQGRSTAPGNITILEMNEAFEWNLCRTLAPCWGVNYIDPTFFDETQHGPLSSYSVKLVPPAGAIPLGSRYWECPDECRDVHGGQLARAGCCASLAYLCTGCPAPDHTDFRIDNIGVNYLGTEVFIVQLLENANGQRGVAFEIRDQVGRLLFWAEANIDQFIEFAIIGCPEGTSTTPATPPPLPPPGPPGPPSPPPEPPPYEP